MKPLRLLLSTLLLTASSRFLVGDTFSVAGDNGHGLISGAPGETIGYDFAFTNGPGYAFLVSSQADVQPLYTSQYLDFVGLNSIEVLPNQSFNQAFSVTPSSTAGLLDYSGLGEFSIDAAAPLGYKYIGVITLSLALFSTDPNIDPNASYTLEDLTAPIGLAIAAPAPTTSVTPEPSALVLIGTGALSGAGMLFRRRKLVSTGLPVRKSRSLV